MSTIYDDDTGSMIEDDHTLATYQPQAARPMPTQGGHIAELQVLASLAAGHVRDPEQMLGRARRVGARMAEAGKAMYSFPAGGGRVEGPTVQMAEALAQEWGYLWTGVRIDSVDGETVMLTAAVFDASTGSYLTRPHMATLPPAPGKFAAKAEQAARWESMQVQAGISKAIRTAILHALPGWYVEAAVVAARNYNRKVMLGEKSLSEAVADTVTYYGKLGVSLAQLEAKAGAVKALWTASDVVDFRGLARSIKNGDATIEGAFPPVVTRTAPAGARPPAEHLNLLPDAGEQPDPLAGARPVEREPVAARPEPAPAKRAARPGQQSIVSGIEPADTDPTVGEVEHLEREAAKKHGGSFIADLRDSLGIDDSASVADLPSDLLRAYRAELKS